MGSQVEPITIALISDFMDDMDAESEELGGKRKFFTRYGGAQPIPSSAPDPKQALRQETL